jgi:2-amino-4-hydroxy-6-hydroxymethyldihydropteridine diphosphokinase
MAEVIVLLGGNVGDPCAILASATVRIVERIGPVLAQSRDHWTEPWGFQDDRLFLNRAIIVDTGSSPEAVLDNLLAIERELGRKRLSKVRYAPRTIDLDILFIGELMVDLPQLVVPHPRVHERAFALGPAADIAPSLVHPVLGRTVLDLLNDRGSS